MKKKKQTRRRGIRRMRRRKVEGIRNRGIGEGEKGMGGRRRGDKGRFRMSEGSGRGSIIKLQIIQLMLQMIQFAVIELLESLLLKEFELILQLLYPFFQFWFVFFHACPRDFYLCQFFKIF